MSRSVTSTVGLRKMSETPEELIQDYIDFLKSSRSFRGAAAFQLPSAFR